MKLHDFVTELKRRNVCKVAIVYGVVAWLFITTRRFAALSKSPLCSCVSITLLASS